MGRNEKKIIRKYMATTGLNLNYGVAIDVAIHESFDGKAVIPLQMVLGEAVTRMNSKGLVVNNVLDAKGHNMSAYDAEAQHHKVIEKLFNELMPYLVGYGDIVIRDSHKRGEHRRHWSLVLHSDVFKMMVKEENDFSGATLKRLRNARIQKNFIDKLGVNTEVQGIDKEYLERLKKQYVHYEMNKEEVGKEVFNLYCESVLMATGQTRYTPTKHSRKLADAHTKCLNRLDGNNFPVTEKLEPRSRTAKQQLALFGMNFYGKTWETQCFKLGEKTEAWDARQSGYQLGGALLGVKPLSRITGTYGKTGQGDIYVSSFIQAVGRVFPLKPVERDVVKKSAQMLIYMAGMKQILVSDDLGLGSLWDHLASEDDDLAEKCALLETELWLQPELEPIMELREAVRNGDLDKYAVPTWSFPGTSEYFYSRSDTNFLAWGDKGEGMRRTASIFMLLGDDGKQHQMTMHVNMIREMGKSSAILPAIFHSLDALLKKLVCIDVWNAGGKILVKHDEFVTTPEFVDIMIASYHKWLAHIARNRNTYLQEPLEQCGYYINLDALVAKNEKRFGKYYPDMITRANGGLAHEWTVDSTSFNMQLTKDEIATLVAENPAA